jgi:alpha-L-fucosidase 2
MANMNPSKDSDYWLAQPADGWMDAIPVGNGRIGAMVFGGTSRERLALNHENLWRGCTRDRTISPQCQHLPEIRQAFFDKRWIDGNELASRYLSGHSRRTQPYQPMGDLLLEMPGHEAAVDYSRSLNLADGICSVRYRVGTVTFCREVFASAEHNVLVLRISADAAAAITGTVALTAAPSLGGEYPWSDGCDVGFRAYYLEGIASAAQARILARGGTMRNGNGAKATVEKADEVTILLALATDYSQGEPKDWCRRHLASVPADYAALRAAHVHEHRSYYQRVTLDLGGDPQLAHQPLNQRINRMRGGQDDPGLLALYFNFGRYLLISSSRRCEQPANLQGIWNDNPKPPWDSDFHLDINLQMNYWPAEVCNLSDCASPLFEWVMRCLPQAQRYARDLYNCRGVLFGLQTDIWDRPSPEAPGWDVWTGAAAWLAEHFWWHYEYTLDRAFLQYKAYPFLKAIAEFYEDFLVRDDLGRLVTVPSQSPENLFVGGANPVSLCFAATMDLLLIREVLGNCLRASEILGVDEPLRPVWRRILEELAPFQIGRHGQLQEWLEDFEEAEPGHRHFSHLLGVFPGEMMTGEELPEFYRAARVSLERRLAYGSGQTGWSAAWSCALWARFCEGGRAEEGLRKLLAHHTTPSLLDLHPPNIFQIDGNFGATAAMAEMLVQSHGGVIRLLPALPAAWSSGRVTGLKARGGFELDITWRDGLLTEARLHNRLGQACKLWWHDLSEQPRAMALSIGNKVLPLTLDDRGYAVLPVEAGPVITLRQDHAADPCRKS